MNKITIFIVLIIIMACTHQNQRYILPSDSQGADDFMLPVNHLEAYHVPDTNELLNETHRNELGCMFILANKQSYEISNQTYLIKANSPIMQLFLTNFPDFNKLNWEAKRHSSGGVVFLRGIEDFLNDKVTCENTLQNT